MNFELNRKAVAASAAGHAIPIAQIPVSVKLNCSPESCMCVQSVCYLKRRWFGVD